jgi:Tfp pilus assembly protein PilZ
MEKGTLRILTLRFSSGRDFLSCYTHDDPDGALLVRTRTPLEAGEIVILDVGFPELPNRFLLQGEVATRDTAHGAWVRIASQDRSVRDFVVGVAQGELEPVPLASRKHPRYPIGLPVDWRLEQRAASEGHSTVLASIEDLSAAGAFVRTEAPPAVGSELEVLLTGPDGETLRIPARVGWTRAGALAPDGMGVVFDSRSEATRRLRGALRKMDERGALDLVPV